MIIPRHERQLKCFVKTYKCYCSKIRNINDQYLEITALTKILGPLCKKIRLKTDYDKLQGLV
jgi:hypothetical protein